MGSYKDSAGRLLQRLKESTTADNLQNWADERIRSSVTKTNDSGFWEGVAIRFEELPPYIQNLAPTDIFVGAGVEREPSPDHIVIAWGGGMGGFFGILVGNSKFSPPSRFGYVTNWQDGIYVWHSDR
jgi:hypothetical protein